MRDECRSSIILVLFLFAFLLLAGICIFVSLVFGGLNFANQVWNVGQSFLLTLCTLLQLVNLFDDEWLDLLLHDWRLLLNYLFSFPCLVLNDPWVLTSQLANKLLYLAFFLPLESLVGHQALCTLNKRYKHVAWKFVTRTILLFGTI